MAGIHKRFGDVRANVDVHLTVAQGTLHGLIGENGAGKSTLMSVLYGLQPADSGSIAVFGKTVRIAHADDAIGCGIGMVHQHFMLVDTLSALENVMLGAEPHWYLPQASAPVRQRLQELMESTGLRVPLDSAVADLSVGDRQRLEILKALYRGARILILDEPTAVLTPQESDSLFATLGQMVAQGLSIVFISHKLDEVLRISHRIAVLRGGKLVADLPAAGADKPMLAEAMVGRRVAPPVRQARAPGAVACELPGTPLALRAGEIVAVAGVAGNGQQALAERLCGQGHEPVLLDGRALKGAPRAFVGAGVARIPEDRHAVGLVGDLPLWENAVLERYATPRFARGGVVRRGAARAFAAGILERFDVRGGGLDSPARALSGGNMQKLILGRALSSGTPKLIVADQPTWGLDIGAVAYVHQQLLDAAAAGSAVLLISEDLDEIFALADRIAVMHHGQLTEARPAADWTLATIGLAMAGGADAARTAH